MKIEVNAMGDACPIPVVKTKNAIRDEAFLQAVNRDEVTLYER